MSELAVAVDQWVDRWVRSNRAARFDGGSIAADESAVRIGVLRAAHVGRVCRRLRREALAGRIDAAEVPSALDMMVCAHEPGAPHLAIVAELPSGWPIGMVSVLQTRSGVGVIRHLWIDRRWRTAALAHRMIELALRRAWACGILKVVLERPRRLRRIRSVFERCGYRFGRRRRVDGHCLIEFYCELYRRVEQPKSVA